MQQRQVFLGLTAFVELFPEPVVGQAEPRGREQIVAVGVVRECSRLPHQRVDHMPVMHRVLVTTDQSRKCVGEFVRVPNLHAVGMKSSFHPLTDQPTVYRVRAAVNVDQASCIDSARHLEVTRQTHIGQTPQRGDLFGEAISPRFVANLHHVLEKLDVLLATGELSTTPQEQRLIDGGFEVAVRRFDIAVLVGLSGIDPLTDQTIVRQEIAVAGLEFSRRRVIVHRCSEAVAAMSSRHTTE